MNSSFSTWACQSLADAWEDLKSSSSEPMPRVTVTCPVSHRTCWRVCSDTSDSSTGQDFISETDSALQAVGPDCQEILEGEGAALFFFLLFSRITWALSSPLQSHGLPVITRFTNFQYLGHCWGWWKLHPCKGLCMLWDILRGLLWFGVRARLWQDNEEKHSLCLACDDRSTCYHVHIDDNPLTFVA